MGDSDLIGLDRTLPEPDGTWSHKETIALLNAYKNYQALFKSKYRKPSNIWETISAHLHKENIMKTKKQCAKKWSNLLRSYNAIIKNKRSGAMTMKFKYFNRVDELIGKKTINGVADKNVIIHSNMQDDEKYGDSNLFKNVYVDTSVRRPSISKTESVVTGKTKRKRDPTEKAQYYMTKKAFVEEKIKAYCENREMKKIEGEMRQRDILSKIEFRERKLELLEKLIKEKDN